MAKSRPPIVRSVRTPEALAALRAWLGTFDEGTRLRGEDYYQAGHVAEVWANADHFVEAEVVGQELYDVTLFLTRGQWSSRCSCPMEADCKHAYAAGLAWTAEAPGAACRFLTRRRFLIGPACAPACCRNAPPRPTPSRCWKNKCSDAGAGWLQKPIR